MKWHERSERINQELEYDHGNASDALIVLQDRAFTIGYSAGIEAAAKLVDKWGGSGFANVGAKIRALATDSKP